MVADARPGALRRRPAPFFTDQRLEGWLAQAPRWSQMPGRERLAAAPHHFLLISASRAGSPRPLDGRRYKDGAAQAPPRRRPARPYLSEVRSLTLDEFKQVPQITRVRDDEGTRIRAVPRSRQLEGATHVVFESQRGQLAGGSHRGRASAPSVPSEQNRAPPSKPTQVLQWTCLWTTQPTLIERGMGVHSNHPLTAQ
jgi:hypothetical protein